MVQSEVDRRMQTTASSLMKLYVVLGQAQGPLSDTFLKYFESLAPPKYQIPPPTHDPFRHCVPVLATSCVARGMPGEHVRNVIAMAETPSCPPAENTRQALVHILEFDSLQAVAKPPAATENAPSRLQATDPPPPTTIPPLQNSVPNGFLC